MFGVFGFGVLNVFFAVYVSRFQRNYVLPSVVSRLIHAVSELDDNFPDVRQFRYVWRLRLCCFHGRRLFQRRCSRSPRRVPPRLLLQPSDHPPFSR